MMGFGMLPPIRENSWVISLSLVPLGAEKRLTVV